MEENIWVEFKPGGKGLKVSSEHRREVRSAAARASHATRRANKGAGSRDKPNQKAPTAVATTEQASKGAFRSESTVNAELKAPSWTEIVLSPQVHAVCLFVISTHTNLCGIHGRAGPHTSCCLFMRGQALRCMQKAADSPPETAFHARSAQLATCLTILAGWEKVYGEEEFYAAHVKALQALQGRVADQGELDDEGYGAARLMSSVWPTVYEQLHAIQALISNDGQLALTGGAEFLTVRPRNRPINPALAPSIFNHDRPETRILLFLLMCLSDHDATSPHAWTDLYQLTLLIFSWHTQATPPASWKELTDPDEFEDLALYLIRAAMLFVLGTWCAFGYGPSTFDVPNDFPSQHRVKLTGDGHKDEGYFRAYDIMDEHYLQLAALEADELLGTQYEEAALWSLFIITSTATAELWQARSLNIIRGLLNNLEIDHFEQLEGVLRKYIYREGIHRRNCAALYETVTRGVPAGKDIGLRTLEVSFADLFL